MAQNCSPFLTIANLSHAFAGAQALSDVSLQVDTGELIVLLGPSGCGKTTLLKMVAGFLDPDAGDILFDGKRMNSVPANRRKIGMVFQNYALFPHMTVAQNIAYGLRARKAAKQTIHEKVREMLAMVQLERFADRLPAQLSGGQQQRVALARALAIDPQIILLDEPFSALDKNLRLGMQIEIKRLIKSYGVTSIMVTHDQEEALSMADRIVVMNEGKIEQIATPQALYDQPTSVFVNSFIGHANFLRGQIAAPSIVRLQCGVELAFSVARDIPVGEAVLVSVRPENLSCEPSTKQEAIKANVRMILPLGATHMIEAETPHGEQVRLALSRAEGIKLPETDEALALRIIDPARVSVFRDQTSPTT